MRDPSRYGSTNCKAMPGRLATNAERAPVNVRVGMPWHRFRHTNRAKMIAELMTAASQRQRGGRFALAMEILEAFQAGAHGPGREQGFSLDISHPR